jgi:HPt (histidine-containing phosphotransfer) domain-containing protein
LYRKLLLSFRDDYRDMTAGITKALAEGDYGLAQRLAHTVKGVAGNISADGLQAAASAVEEAVKEGRYGEAGQTLEPFNLELKRVLRALDELDQGRSDCQQAPWSGMIDLPALLTVLVELKPHLQKSKMKQIKAQMEKAAALMWADEAAGDLAALKMLVGKFKYKEALPVLESLIETLQRLGGSHA